MTLNFAATMMMTQSKSQPLSEEVLSEHYFNYLRRIEILKDEIDQEAGIYYINLLHECGLEVGDRVKYHNAIYYVTSHVVLSVNYKNEMDIDFALSRLEDGTSLRWLPIIYIDELVKIIN